MITRIVLRRACQVRALDFRGARCFSSEQKPNPEQNKVEVPKQKVDPNNPLKEFEDKYVYDKQSVETVNNKQFIEKIRKLENQNKKEAWALDGLKFPLLLIGASLFIYHCWDTVPYGIVYRHAAISEYIPREHYYHAVLLSTLSLPYLLFIGLRASTPSSPSLT